MLYPFTEPSSFIASTVIGPRLNDQHDCPLIRDGLHSDCAIHWVELNGQSRRVSVNCNEIDKCNGEEGVYATDNHRRDSADTKKPRASGPGAFRFEGASDAPWFTSSPF